MADFEVSSLLSNKADIINQIIHNTFIVEFGIIKAINAKGIVTVEMSVAKDTDNIVITDCVLASTVSKSFSIDIIPQIDDKVIVLFPKNFNPLMFQSSKNEAILTDVSKGYNLMGGIAILMNQFIPSENKNKITIDNGNITINYADNDTSISLTSSKDNKAINIADGNSNSIVMSSDGLVLNGKLTVKN